MFPFFTPVTILFLYPYITVDFLMFSFRYSKKTLTWSALTEMKSYSWLQSFSKAVVQKCSVKRVLWKISQYSQENIRARVFFLITFQVWGFFIRTPLMPASACFSYDMLTNWNLNQILENEAGHNKVLKIVLSNYV